MKKRSCRDLILEFIVTTFLTGTYAKLKEMFLF